MKKHPKNINVTYDSNYVRLNTSGTVEIYISGFCTEELLKMIQERKQKKRLYFVQMTQCFVHSDYSLNPDRGSIYGWNISYDASYSWW